MPHKRAKRLVRERAKVQRATDLAPAISTEREPIPKSVSRVLDAEQIRREYRRKKRQLDEVGNSCEDTPQRTRRRHDATHMKHDGESTALKIKPSETVAQFDRRVENSMMPLIKTALQQSSTHVRRVRREEAAQKTLKRGKQGHKARHPLLESPKKISDPLPTVTGGEEIVYARNARKEFQATVPRRLNDIAQEPPAIKNFPFGATKHDAAPSGVLSMAQKVMIEEERDRAIRHYRELKARKLHESGSVKLGG